MSIGGKSETGTMAGAGRRDGWYRPLLVPGLATVALLAAFAGYELHVMGRGPLAEFPPQFDLYHLARTLGLILCVGWVVIAVDRSRRDPAAMAVDTIGPGTRIAIWLSAAFSIAATGLFLVEPAWFSRLAREDHAVEWASAAALLAGAVLAGRAAFVFRSRARPGAALMAVGFALLLFVIAMEELSWMQRVIGFETPGWLPPNRQGEANLHNLATGLSENAYYFGAFLFLVLLPFANRARPVFPAGHPLAGLVPGSGTALLAAPMAGFVWDMWNVLSIQFATIATLSIVGVFLHDAIRRDRAALPMTMVAVAGIVVPLAIFLVRGEAQVRLWDTTEYRELFIAIGLLSAAVSMMPARDRVRAP